MSSTGSTASTNLSSTTSSTSTTSSSSSSSSTSSSSSSSSTSSSSVSSATSSSSSSSTSATSSSTSTLTASSTTDVQSTVVSTSADGQTFTTVVTTQSVLPPGATVTAASNSSSSKSTTGKIVGGAVGGGAGALILILILTIWWRRHRQRQRSLDAFDGNFDPDRIVTQKPVKGEPKALRGQGPTLPDIPTSGLDNADDDGMGGRLAGTAVGAGVVAPYQLYHPTNASSRPHTEMSAQHTGISTSTQGNTRSASTGIPASVYSAAYGNNNLRPGASGAPPSTSGSSSVSPYGFGPAEPLPNPFGPGPESVVSSSNNTHSGAPTGSGSGYNRFNVANPDPESSSAGFVGGFAPGVLTGRGEKSVTGPSGAGRSREVLVHQDGGRVEEGGAGEEEEGPDEIPPTYDSLVPGGSSAPRPPEKR
ncbi:hypothetical protein GYMLUDRAFT_571084 [Collybiopsis luxurians FD-317 M1]|uniref:REJ domain-containing protein n=1 Tax=Collybiopsis luxurians FD-317 M1 TaxID=944289 RepID=A0A0D0CGC7_9AGAR|nr:hypothetical protein GYMLUDRAFT_571084 [Collybiopsis luxurians FD-317 M1]